MARLDRLERRMTISGGDPSSAPVVATEPESVLPAPHSVEPTVIEPVRPAAAETTPEPAPEPTPAPTPEPTPEPTAESGPERAIEPQTHATPEPGATTTPAGSTLTLVDVRRLWPDIVEATKQRRRLTWIYLTQQAQVVAVDDSTLTLGFTNAGARDSFDNGGSAEIVRQAAIDVVGSDWKVETIVDPGAQPSATQSPVTPAPTPDAPTPPEPTVAVEPPATTSTTDPAAVAAAREAIQQTRVPGKDPAGDPRAAADAEAHPDDDDVDSSALAGAELLQQHLGAEVIEEIKHH